MKTGIVKKFFRKIPGFRSGSKIKAVIASVFYFFLLLFLIVIIVPSAPTLALDETTPTNQNQAKISGKTFTGKPLWLLKDNQVVSQIKAESGGRFKFEVEDLTEGKNKFIVKACREEEQERCTEKEIVVIVDKTPPQTPIIDSFPKETNQEKVTIKGVGEKENEIRVLVNGEEKTKVETDQNGIFEAEILLSEGKNEVKAKAIDRANNQSEFSKEIEITYIRPLEPTPTSTPIPSPTYTPTPKSSVSFPTTTPTRIPTPTSIPTPTVKPSPTPSPRPTLTPTSAFTKAKQVSLSVFKKFFMDHFDYGQFTKFFTSSDNWDFWESDNLYGDKLMLAAIGEDLKSGVLKAGPNDTVVATQVVSFFMLGHPPLISSGWVEEAASRIEKGEKKETTLQGVDASIMLSPVGVWTVSFIEK